MEHGMVMCGEYVNASYAAAAAEVFASLADISRIRVVLALGDDEVSANHLADILEMPPAEIQQHLAALEVLEVVAARTHATVRFFRLSDKHVRHLVFGRLQRNERSEQDPRVGPGR
jgi:DNA-binding transcriptional ArsR family regulator